MPSITEYDRIVYGTISGFPNPLQWSSSAEAKTLKRFLTQFQKQLRLLKKSVSEDIRQLNSGYQSEKARVGKTIVAGLASIAFGPRRVGRFNTIERDSLRRQQYNAVEPYQQLKNRIDGLIAQLDGLKIQIDCRPSSEGYSIAVGGEDFEPPLPVLEVAPPPTEKDRTRRCSH